MVIRQFSDLIAPVTVEHFARKYWTKEFLHLEGAADRFQNLFSWDQLNQALETRPLSALQMRLGHSRSILEEKLYTTPLAVQAGTPDRRLDTVKLYELLRSGATLVLDAVDAWSSDLSNLCESLSRCFKTQVRANCYATWREVPAFGVHFDAHDVIVLQIAGRKLWKIYPVTRQHPTFRDMSASQEKPTVPIWEGVLEAGDLLYIPRGQWHEVIGLNEPTLHLSIGLDCPTGLTLLGWLAEQVHTDAQWRQTLPIFGDTSDAEEHATALRDALVRVFTPDIIAQFFSSFGRVLAARPHLSLPHGILPEATTFDRDTRIRFAGAAHSPIVQADGGFAFDAMGRSWHFEETVAPMLRPLLAGEFLSLGTLMRLGAHACSEREVMELVSALVSDGLLAVDRSGNR
jgi:ribosomal protein L16 Arg81 hydroxylase